MSTICNTDAKQKLIKIAILLQKASGFKKSEKNSLKCSWYMNIVIFLSGIIKNDVVSWFWNFFMCTHQTQKILKKGEFLCFDMPRAL